MADLEGYPVIRIDQIPLLELTMLEQLEGDVRVLMDGLLEEENGHNNPLYIYLQRQIDKTRAELAQRNASIRILDMLEGRNTNVAPSTTLNLNTSSSNDNQVPSSSNNMYSSASLPALACSHNNSSTGSNMRTSSPPISSTRDHSNAHMSTPSQLGNDLPSSNVISTPPPTNQPIYVPDTQTSSNSNPHSQKKLIEVKTILLKKYEETISVIIFRKISVARKHSKWYITTSGLRL